MTTTEEDKKQKLIQIMGNFKAYSQCFLKIRTKDSDIIPFVMNAPQERLYKVIQEQQALDKPVRIIILKARQTGFSTLTEAFIFWKTSTRRLTNSLIVAHKDDSSTNLFNMSKLFYEMLPDGLRPTLKSSNAKEFLFENPTKDTAIKKKNPGLRSKIKIATAGGEGIGRSDTLSNVHLSELAWWSGDPKVTLNGIMQSVPKNKDTMVIIESTANGLNMFSQLWDDAVKGESDFIPFFCAWHELKEYRLPVNENGKQQWEKYKKHGDRDAIIALKLTAEEMTLIEIYNLDLEQIKWRRWCIKNNCGNDDNFFNQEYPACPEEAFLTTGTAVFDNANVILRKRYLETQEKPLIGDVVYEYDLDRQLIQDDSIRFVENPQGSLKVYTHPVPNRPYVIGGDIAEGGKDFSTMQVLDNITGQQVAVWRGHTDTDLYGKMAYCLGKYYNTALIGVETNFDTHPVKELSRLGYCFQYMRMIMDKIGTEYQDKFGFVTSPVTRPVIIATLVSIVRENIEVLNDLETLTEMLTFSRNKVGKPEAENGKHDDLILALAIAFQIREQQTMLVTETTEPKSEREIQMRKLLNIQDQDKNRSRLS